MTVEINKYVIVLWIVATDFKVFIPVFWKGAGWKFLVVGFDLLITQLANESLIHREPTS